MQASTSSLGPFRRDKYPRTPIYDYSHDKSTSYSEARQFFQLQNVGRRAMTQHDSVDNDGPTSFDVSGNIARRQTYALGPRGNARGLGYGASKDHNSAELKTRQASPEIRIAEGDSNLRSRML